MIYKYSFDAKIEAVRLYIRLKNAAEAGRILNVSSSLILMWHRQFLVGGPKALIPQSSGNEYDVYDRILITEELLKKDLTLTDASAMFGVSIRTLRRWLKSVQQPPDKQQVTKRLVPALPAKSPPKREAALGLPYRAPQNATRYHTAT